MSAFSLLRHRESLVLNTSNPSFLLFWLRVAREKGYLPVVLTGTELEGESFYADALAFFRDEKIAWLPLYDTGASPGGRSGIENHVSRFLDDLYRDNLELVISSRQVFGFSVPDQKGLREHMLHLRAGEHVSFSGLPPRLAEMGYQRADIVEYCGEFTVRGGIVDIYPYGETYPLRLEFFGDTLESLRRFNPNDQITFESCENAQVRPASFSAFSRSTVADILPANTLVISLADDKHPDNEPAYVPGLAFKQVVFNGSAVGSDVVLPVLAAEVPRDVNDSSWYENLLSQKKRLFVFSEHELVRASLFEKLGDHAAYVNANVRFGFHYKPLDLILLSGRQFYHKERYANPNSRFIPEQSTRVDSVESLRYGDVVVHVDYGVGIYRGIEMLDFRGIRQESMVIEYQNRDKVFVPIRFMNKIFRYSSDNASHVAIDQIGSSRWEQAKATTRKHLRQAAFDLISLYRDRKQLPGISFEKDTPDLLRLEASFPYEETRDQRIAINEITADMEKPGIMDRLICGDVGFGKTEVAIRAAFKAVYSGKQVAVLVPTTVLCFQHYESFRERLSSFGIRVDHVNRFVSGARLVKLMHDLAAGAIDVLVGTHKILSNTMLFKDLGLLVIDEEHRFGVNHKEKIQNMKRRVDVITLTATPIPRTLQLALAGLRDITKIDTPPKERLPISTKIIYWKDEDIRIAIGRELERNGQVFILNNNISELPVMRDKIAALFPGSTVRYAHGKMHGPELEKTLLDFHHHRFDILISTTIIESGIDVPNANTLIVLNAHTFGLSQLYQIRGRVGRSYKKAFAYLVIPRGKHVNPVAMKRLQTLEYYTDLGSGYQIAMRDLEIRGAGSLFGVEQSGHINRFGFAYYNRMFSEEVAAVKSGKQTSLPAGAESPDIQLSHPAYLPETYIDNKDIRIAFYRELSDALNDPGERKKSLQRIEHLEVACRDRFGPLPPEAENLFHDARLAHWLSAYHVDTLSLIKDAVLMTFSASLPPEEIRNAAGRLLYLMNEHKIAISFISKQQLVARVDPCFLAAFKAGTFH